MNHNLIDPDDFCRTCRGSGTFREWNAQRRVDVTSACYTCNGTGRKTVRVFEVKEVKP